MQTNKKKGKMSFFESIDVFGEMGVWFIFEINRLNNVNI